MTQGEWLMMPRASRIDKAEAALRTVECLRTWRVRNRYGESLLIDAERPVR